MISSDTQSLSILSVPSLLASHTQGATVLCLLAFVGLVVPAEAQEATFPLSFRAADGSGAVELTLGVDPDATPGIDNGIQGTDDLGEESLPPLVPDVFDVRFTGSNLGNGVNRDVRQGQIPVDGTRSHRVTLVIPTDTDVVLEHDLPPGAEGQLNTSSGITNRTITGDGTTTLKKSNLDHPTPNPNNRFRIDVTMTYTGLSGGGPTAGNDNVATSEDQPVTVDVRANDQDPEGDALTPSVAVASSNGGITINPDGTLTYNPDADFNGADSFTYEVADGFGGTARATVSVVVNATNDAPTVDANKGLILKEGAAASITDQRLRATDVDDDDGAQNLTYTVTNDPSHGRVELTTNPGAPIRTFTQADLNAGRVQYVHDGSQTSSDAFAFTLADDDGDGPAQETFSITINTVNDPPGFSGRADLSAQTIPEDGSTGPLDFSVQDEETAAGDLSVSAESDRPDVVSASGLAITGPDANGDAQLTITPRPDSNGAVTIRVIVSDQAGGEATSAFTLGVQSINDPPTTGDDDYSVVSGQRLEVTESKNGVLANDRDVDGDNLSASVVRNPASGSLTLNDDGTFRYSPDEGFLGEDTFTYQADDGDGGEAEATVTITVTSANAAPTATDDEYQAILGTTLSVGAADGVLANDSDADGDALSAALESGPSHGTLDLRADGSFAYTPAEGFAGTDTFTYAATDPSGASDAAQVTVRVVSANAPQATGDSYATGEEEALVVSPASQGVLANDSDADGDPLTARLVTGVAHGQLTLNGDGTFQYQPSAGFSGTDQFVYAASDGTGRTDQATATIQVIGKNDPPTISGLSDQTIDEDQSTGAVPFTVGDEETAASNLLVTASSSDPSLVPDANLALGGSGTERTVEAVPATNEHGEAQVTLTVSDGEKQASATFVLTVRPVNDAPTVLTSIPDSELEVPGPPLQLTGLQGTVFRDVDDRLAVEATSSAPSVVSVAGEDGAGGAVTEKASGGSVTLRPEAPGTAEITLTASDGEAEATAEPFTITVVEMPEGEAPPDERARAVVDSTEGDSTEVDFGETGTGATFQSVRKGGTIDVSFFGGSGGNGGEAAAVRSGASAGAGAKAGATEANADASEAGASQAKVGATEAKAGATEDFRNVSPYRWEVDAGGAEFASVDVRFRLSDEDVTGVRDPRALTVLVDTTGEGTFVAVPTRFSDRGTPSDATDDVVVAEGLTALGTFRLASDANPLPVELSRFTATGDGRAAVLRWRTASETNNAGFEVQHQGPDADGYVPEGFVEGAGTTTEPQTYRFRVSGLAPGTHRFRLRQVDVGGTATLSEAVVVAVEAERALTLDATGPNPARQSTQMAFTVKQSGRATVTLYNVLGQRVRRVAARQARAGERQTVAVPVVGLPSGTYFVRLQAPTGTRTQKLLVVR